MTKLLEKPAIQALLICLLGAAAYANTLHVPFLFDDNPAIVNNPLLDTLWGFFSAPDWDSPFFRARWFAFLTFAVNKSLTGLTLPPLHVTNILIHLATALLVWRLSAVTLAGFGVETKQHYRFAPFLAALLFVLHPVQTQAVTYLVQRMASLATLLYLAAMLLYRHAAVAGRKRLLWYVGALAVGLLAMGTKEISFTLPLALVLYDVCFLAGEPGRRAGRLAPFVATIAILPFVIYRVGAMSRLASIGGDGGLNIPLPHVTYLITELRVAVTYLRLLILPVGQCFDYDYPVYRSLLERQAGGALLFLLGMLWLGIRLIAVRQGASHALALSRIGGFAIIWFLLTLVPESGAVPLLDVIVEHRLYLPSVWPCIAAGLLFEYARLVAGKQQPVVIVFMVIVIIALGLASWRRNALWRDEPAIWGDTLAKMPNNERAWASLGEYHVKRLEYSKAIPLLERAVALNLGFYPAVYKLGVALYMSGETLRGRSMVARAADMAPDFVTAWKKAGQLFLITGQAGDAQYYLRHAALLAPSDVETHALLNRAVAAQEIQKGR